MTPNEIVDTLTKMGITISRKTLYNYEKWGLISTPLFRNSRNTDYPNHVIEEAFVAWRFLHGEYGDDETRNFFVDKLPTLSPIAVLAVKNFSHVLEVRESLEFLLKREEKEKGRWFSRPDEKVSNKLASEIDEIRGKVIKSTYNHFMDLPPSITCEAIRIQTEEEKRMHIALEEKIQSLIVNNRKRYRAVLMIQGNTYMAIKHEEAEYKKCIELYGNATNKLKQAYHDIYIREIKKAKDILKTL